MTKSMGNGCHRGRRLSVGVALASSAVPPIGCDAAKKRMPYASKSEMSCTQPTTHTGHQWMPAAQIAHYFTSSLTSVPLLTQKYVCTLSTVTGLPPAPFSSDCIRFKSRTSRFYRLLLFTFSHVSTSAQIERVTFTGSHCLELHQ